MIEFDEYKVKLNNIRPKLDALSDSLGIEEAKEEIERLHAQIDSDGFWDNQEVSQKVMKQSRQLESKVELYERMCSQWDDLYTLCDAGRRAGFSEPYGAEHRRSAFYAVSERRNV